jgi:hypothetical protein
LGTAQAEVGQWKEAVATARQGQKLADKHHIENLSHEIRHRLDLFEREVPYHYGE